MSPNNRPTKGQWFPSHQGKIETGSTSISNALLNLNAPIYMINVDNELSAVSGGSAILGAMPPSADIPENIPATDLLAYAPPLPLENLGDPSFKARHGLKYPYIAGAMANGITSTRMVEAMAKNGMMGFFGAGGLSLSNVEEAILTVKKHIGIDTLPHGGENSHGHAHGHTSVLSSSSVAGNASTVTGNERALSGSAFSPAWGFNLIHSHGDPDLEMAVVNLYLKHGVHCISAAAFMRITLPLVYFRLKGITRDMEGRIITPHRIIAKVSRIEVARQFFAPPPEKLVNELLNLGLITPHEADLAPHIPMAQDLTAEADSGGHTDNRPAIALLPTLLALKDEFNARYSYPAPLCVGLAGGIATPESTAAAFQMGAAYVLTGSINQSCLESGTSDVVRTILCQAEQADVAMAPAADMFEIGAKVQVLKRGTMFAVRADKLYHTYKSYDAFEAVPQNLRQEIEEKFLQSSFDQKWQETEAFFKVRNPKELERAKKDPRHKMSLVFRSYLGLSSRWAISGDPARRMDYQIWCGPAMGAFNQWVKGTFLEGPAHRRVADIALNLLVGASVSTRAGWLRSQGITLPTGCGTFRPIEREALTAYL